MIVASYVWELPKVRNGFSAEKLVLNGWQMTGLVQHRSGDALTITSGTNNSGTSLGRDRAVYGGAQPYGSAACGASPLPAAVGSCLQRSQRTRPMQPTLHSRMAM